MATTETDRIRILWRVLMVAPNGLPQWISILAGCEAEAVAELERIRPAWTVREVQRERNP